MLVFACGLIAVLFAQNSDMTDAARKQPQQLDVEIERESPELPEGIRNEGQGFEPVGLVYLDPKTGKMFSHRREK
ncbi:hypothetical protein GWO43_03225 [candidate division KSB1 bacterium]|nr:hypothetical protein [candidate division KSB1 bacterium]NIR70909.1 hypothetical protein [candidate division KSB1 bacterium]NIS23081.1 hypothetical protein [candidate division KSB1 bacterium]NIT69916.1 hypothetical protein [candidate division KSB1 bacterium]NIU23582.1 hypothetical protein [candidate division KSB1 bacterium]